MAVALRKFLWTFERNAVQCRQSGVNFCKFSTKTSGGSASTRWRLAQTCAVVGSGGLLMFAALQWNGKLGTVYALKQKKKDEELLKAVKLTSRERRFIKFASVEFDGQLYMTPQDFLESVVEQEPRPRLKRRMLTEKEVEKVKDETPALKKGSSRMFRTLRDKGIISYTEYLFLLSILTKPQSGFRIAFNMFDTDGNERVDKNEFLVLVELLGHHWRHIKSDYDEVSKRLHSQMASSHARARTLSAIRRSKLMNVVRSVTKNRSLLREAHNAQSKQHEQQQLQQQTALLKTKSQTKPSYLLSVMEKIFSHAWKDKRGVKSDAGGEGSPDQEYVDDDQGLQRRHIVDTTLTVHFFGKKGKEELKFEGFQRFMENLQSEVLELEFHEFSKGHNTISESDFAKILLRYTYLDTDEYDMFLDRLLDRVKEEKGITFEEFKGFCQFLNNLEDFAIAMKMYTLADHPISKDEFHRAVKICTGNSLSRHLVHTVFAIFDADGDGHLSYREFIAIMKDRLHRGFKVIGKGEGTVSWRTCVIEELKKQ